MNPSRLKLSALAALMLLAGSACAIPPDGSDGDLVNQWPAMAAPTIWQPIDGACHNRLVLTLAQGGYTQVACTTSHRHQTVHVGQFSGDAASQPRPPEAGSATYRSAWNECDSRLTAFLGGQWRERKLGVRLGIPSPAAWEAGARWYSCEAAVVEDWHYAATTIEESLKGAFGARPTLKFSCYNVPEKGDSSPTSCNEPHNAEFVGFVNFVDMSWAELEVERAKERDRVHDLCQKVIGTFVGAVAANRSGTWVWQPAEEDWSAGDRTMRCFLWLEDAKVSKSLKGVGASGWPLK